MHTPNIYNKPCRPSISEVIQKKIVTEYIGATQTECSWR